MNRLRQLIADLGAALDRLSPRERGLVALTAGVLTVFLIFVFSLSVSRATARRESRIRTKLTQLEEIHKLTANYRQEEQKRTDLESRLRGNRVQLFSYLEDLARRQGIDIGGMTDKGGQPLGDSHIVEHSVEVPFTRISLDKLVRFLSEVEGGEGMVKVTRMQIRPRSDEAVIDAWLVVSTYRMENG